MEAPDLTARNTAACGMVTVSERKATSVVAMPAKLRESGAPLVAIGVPPTKTCAAGELEVPGTGGDTRTIRHTTLMAVGALADTANSPGAAVTSRSEELTSALQPLMRISSAVVCLTDTLTFKSTTD